MISREFKKIYHPKLGRYVYMQRGNGLIVDNTLKLVGKKLKDVGKKVVAPFVKKTAKKGLSKGGEKLGRMVSEKIAEKSGDLIRKRLNGQMTPKTPRKPKKAHKKAE